MQDHVARIGRAIAPTGNKAGIIGGEALIDRGARRRGLFPRSALLMEVKMTAKVAQATEAR
jgi:hypothetical protein